MAEKRALLVGCNYPGSDAELKGCVNDVMSIKSMLLEYYGFQEANISIQIDTDKAFPQPTGKAIKDELARLVSLCKPGDVLVFHFSGHGTQISDPTSDEADGKDEAICPTDLNVICDDDLRAIFSKMPDGVLFTMISDCCHSGSMLDHPEQQISGNKDPNAPPGAAALPVPDLMSMFGMKSAPAPEEQKNRAMDQNMFINVFNMIKGGGAGGAPMDNTNVRAVLSKQFGADGSAKMLGAAKKLDDLLAQHGAKIAAANKQAGQAVGVVRKLLGCFLGSSNSTTTTAAAAPTGGAVPTSAAPGSAAHKPPPNQQLGADKGILITGCQSMETSADACPSGDPKQAFGALTNALTTCVKAAKANDKAAPITYRQLVTDVRAMLLKGGFTQNPCLECSDKNVDTVFICP